MSGADDRYMVISADCHAGGALLDYRPYLERQWFDEFDDWAAQFVNPYGDMMLSAKPDCNWDSSLRTQMLEADGVVAEVLFPNTVPPFYPQTSFMVPGAPESGAEYRRRWAGLRAHNRWMVDFCADTPGRRAGVAQIMLNDIDDAVAEVRWAKAAGLTGGVLLPGVAPNSNILPLWSPEYEPLWAVCEELQVPVNSHGGGGAPHYDHDELGDVMRHLEGPWFCHRTLWHLIFSGVFERHPELVFVMTEQGSGWVTATLSVLDAAYDRYHVMGSAPQLIAGAAALKLPRRPSEYYQQNCYLGASFLHRNEADRRHEIGVGKMMWGVDFPHIEGSYPYSRQALRATFAEVPEDEVKVMLSETAARIYSFDPDFLRPIADRVGPLVSETHTPLDEYPVDSFCNAFDRNRPLGKL